MGDKLLTGLEKRLPTMKKRKFFLSFVDIDWLCCELMGHHIPLPYCQFQAYLIPPISLFLSYGSKIPPSTLADRVATYMHYFTLHGSLRPFGTSALIASYDTETKEHSLQMVEPSGVSYEYFGCAAGKGRQPAKTELEKLIVNKSPTDETLNSRDGVKQLARIIHSLHEEGKDKPFELEMSWLCEETGWIHKGVPRDYIKEAVEWAKKDIEEAEEGGESDEDDEMED